MALVLKDRVRESSSTSGTGTITLAGAATGFDSFASIGDGNTTYYAIIDTIAGEWEVGLGTYTASGTTLSRDTVLESSNSDTLVNFAANTKDVICTYPADKSVFLSADGSLSLHGALSATGAVTGSNLNVSNWDTAYGWGDHASAGYVIADGAVVINESGADVDFRIESDTDTHAFFLEGSNGNVGIGTSSPGYTLQVNNNGGDYDAAATFVDNGVAASWARIDLSHQLGGGSLFLFQNQVGQTGIRNDSTNASALLDIVAGGTGNPSETRFFSTPTTETMRIDSSGNVGIGTSSPSYKAEIDSGSLGTSLNDRSDTLRLTTTTSNVDTLNFSKIRTSAGTDWQTAGWRLQQRIDFTNMGYIQLNGDSNSQGISFGVGDSTEHMRINSAGDVGIGTASPSTKLDVNGSVTASGDVTAYSDERLKENWKDLPEGFVESLAGVKSGTYNRIDLNGKQQVGVSAQSLQTVLPDAVRELNDTLTVNYGNAALASAIELAKKVVELEARIKELEVK
jgi:hypothetical protein